MLEISPAKVAHVIFQSREGDMGEDELRAFIAGLNEDEQAHLVAIAWVRTKYMETPFFRSVMQVIVGGALVLAAGAIIGSA